MKTILNTTFFFTADNAAQVRERLVAEWLPALRACAVEPPRVFAMDAEEDVVRLAIHGAFADRKSAENFWSEVIDPLADRFVKDFGADRFTHFTTLMGEIDL